MDRLVLWFGKDAWELSVPKSLTFSKLTTFACQHWEVEGSYVLEDAAGRSRWQEEDTVISWLPEIEEQALFLVPPREEAAAEGAADGAEVEEEPLSPALAVSSDSLAARAEDVETAPASSSSDTLALANVQDELWRIFTHYSMSGCSARKERVDRMSAAQFLRLLADCRVHLYGRDIGKAELDLIYVKETARGSFKGSRNTLFSFEDFVGALMHVASHVYSSQPAGWTIIPGRGRVWSTPALSTESFLRLLFEHILPYASRWERDNTHLFLQTDEVEAVFEHFRETIILLYQIYAGVPLSAGRNDEEALLSWPSFLQLANDFAFNLIGLSSQEVCREFLASKTLPEDGDWLAEADDGRRTRISIQEFVECLGRCALVGFSKTYELSPLDMVKALFSHMNTNNQLEAAAADRLARAPVPRLLQSLHAAFSKMWHADGLRNYLCPPLHTQNAAGQDSPHAHPAALTGPSPRPPSPSTSPSPSLSSSSSPAVSAALATLRQLSPVPPSGSASASASPRGAGSGQRQGRGRGWGWGLGEVSPAGGEAKEAAPRERAGAGREGEALRAYLSRFRIAQELREEKEKERAGVTAGYSESYARERSRAIAASRRARREEIGELRHAVEAVRKLLGELEGEEEEERPQQGLTADERRRISDAARDRRIRLAALRKHLAALERDIARKLEEEARLFEDRRRVLEKDRWKEVKSNRERVVDRREREEWEAERKVRRGRGGIARPEHAISRLQAEEEALEQERLRRLEEEKERERLEAEARAREEEARARAEAEAAAELRAKLEREEAERREQERIAQLEAERAVAALREKERQEEIEALRREQERIQREKDELERRFAEERERAERETRALLERERAERARLEEERRAEMERAEEERKRQQEAEEEKKQFEEQKRAEAKEAAERAAEDDRAEELREHAILGGFLDKYNKGGLFGGGKAQLRFVQARPATHSLVWGKTDKALESSLALGDVLDVKEGICTPVLIRARDALKKSPEQSREGEEEGWNDHSVSFMCVPAVAALEETAFSLITAQRTLDLAAKSQQQRETWVAALRLLVTQAKAEKERIRKASISGARAHADSSGEGKVYAQPARAAASSRSSSGFPSAAPPLAVSAAGEEAPRPPAHERADAERDEAFASADAAANGLEEETEAPAPAALPVDPEGYPLLEVSLAAQQGRPGLVYRDPATGQLFQLQAQEERQQEE